METRILGLVVKLARPEDEAEWRRLWKAYLAFYETERSDAVYDASWARIMDEGSKLFCYLAHLDGKTIGLSNFLYHDSFWEAEDRCYLNDLYVDPEVRGSGAGAALIEATYAHAKSCGASQLYWTTAHDNEVARGLYDKLANLTPFIKYNKL